MDWGEFIGAIIVALLVGAIFYYGFKSTGPWGTFWTFLLVLIVGIWFLAAVANPIGPVWWGIAWIDLFIFGILFALILAAATPSTTDRRRHREYYVTSEKEERDVTAAAVAISVWFWIMIVFFFIAALVAAVSY